jgi:hypothetical protein
VDFGGDVLPVGSQQQVNQRIGAAFVQAAGVLGAAGVPGQAGHLLDINGVKRCAGGARWPLELRRYSLEDF